MDRSGLIRRCRPLAVARHDGVRPQGHDGIVRLYSAAFAQTTMPPPVVGHILFTKPLFEMPYDFAAWLEPGLTLSVLRVYSTTRMQLVPRAASGQAAAALGGWRAARG